MGRGFPSCERQQGAALYGDVELWGHSEREGLMISGAEVAAEIDEDKGGCFVGRGLRYTRPQRLMERRGSCFEGSSRDLRAPEELMKT